MFKAVLATALLASTTLAYEFVEAYTNEIAPRTILHLHDVIHFDYFYNFDFGYSGYYKTEPNDETRRIKDAIGLKLFSHVKAQFNLELFSHFKAQIEFSFIPIEIIPVAM